MPNIEIRGINELTKKLDPEIVKKAISVTIRRIALYLGRETKIATPVDTGRLRASITTEIQPHFARIGTIVKYANFVEYGTRRMAPRHLERGIRVKGWGMFAHALKLIQGKLEEFMNDMAKYIEVKFEK